MALRSLLIVGLIVAIANLSKVTGVSYCCDFSSHYYCDWKSVDWETAPATLPNTASYPGFRSTAPDTYYAWLQDKSSSISSNSGFTVSSKSSWFSFNYYYSSSSQLTGSYLDVVFHNNNKPLSPVHVARITVPEDGWRTFNVVCDRNVDFCCGSSDAIPCTGWIEIIGQLDETRNEGLFGIDNFCGDDIITTPTTPTTTTTTTEKPITWPTPSPDPDFCCQFQNDVCGFYTGYPYVWYWSKQIRPPIPPPSFNGSTDSFYLWTNINGAVVYVTTPVYIEPDSYLSLDYYLSSPTGQIEVVFTPTGYGPSLKNILSYNAGQWRTFVDRTTNWCIVSPCHGTISLTYNDPYSSGIAAIDNADVNGACHSHLPCCYFDDSEFCQLTPINPSGLYDWEWSGFKAPVFAVPPTLSGTDFIYFETQSYIGGEYYATLRSQLITISSEAVFKASVYVYTPTGMAGSDSLQLNFREYSTDTVISMDFAKDTSSRWYNADFQCDSIHGDCCQGLAPTCSGYLEITAYVEANGGTVFYGLDALEINNKCVPFPGSFNVANVANQH
ncbi:hypothetical protein CHUAL_008312 [Chamberlinius hualienensis]